MISGWAGIWVAASSSPWRTARDTAFTGGLSIVTRAIRPSMMTRTGAEAEARSLMAEPFVVMQLEELAAFERAEGDRAQAPAGGARSSRATRPCLQRSSIRTPETTKTSSQ